MSGQQELPPKSGDVRKVPVAAYVRMSTTHQQYSTENQIDRIREYATRRGMEISRVYEDTGEASSGSTTGGAR